MKDISIHVENAGPQNDIQLIHVMGIIDSNTSHEVNQIIKEILGKKYFKIVVDLENVNYISSAGWGIFIGEIRMIQSHHGDLKLAALTPEVEEVYQLLEFFNILKAYASVDEAIKSF